jgi:hypothetical protein
MEPQNREERSPAEPEIRNPKLEIRNKSELPGMGQWANAKPRRFFAGGEQSRLLQYREDAAEGFPLRALRVSAVKWRSVQLPGYGFNPDIAGGNE